MLGQSLAAGFTLVVVAFVLGQSRSSLNTLHARLRDAIMSLVGISSKEVPRLGSSKSEKPAPAPLQPDELERDTSQENLLRRYERFAYVSSEGLWELELATHKVHYSARWQALVGLEPEPLDADIAHWLGRIHPDDKARVSHVLNTHIDNNQAFFNQTFFELEYRLRHHKRGYLQVSSRATGSYDADGKLTHLTGALCDLSKRSMFDALTGLPNRALLGDRLEHALSLSQRNSERRCALLYMDLNNFKVVNDSFGHRTGDLLLKELARRLQLCVRSQDTVARLGGDEFVVLLEDLDSDVHLQQVLSRIERYTSSSFELEGKDIVSSVSVGVVADLGAFDTAEEVLRNADIAMYSAKGQGLAHALFDPPMHAQVAERQRLEVDLRAGLERGELFLVYQPIVSLATGEAEGYEALVRWQHPQRGVVGPHTFIPIAEETGLILSLGEWVLREACFQIKHINQVKHINQTEQGRTGALPATDLPYVSVNLSGRQLSQLDLSERVERALLESGLEPQRLKLEVTESSVIKDPERSAQILQKLKTLGVHICMDDFGTGYSSLNYIHHLPIDVLKIDQSFIRKMHDDPRSLAVVRTMTEMARQLGMSVIPEGIESVAQKETLETLNCVLGQGYLFSKPQLLEALIPK